MITLGLLFLGVMLLTSCLLASPAQAQAVPSTSKPLPKRVVYLGDSITDGHTYALLLDQALRDAGVTPWLGINAGIGGHNAKQTLDRLDRDVLAHQPELVTIMIGTNDAAQGVSLASYQQSVTAICDQLDRAGIPVMLLTAPPLGPMHVAKHPSIEAYNTFLRALAQQRSYRLAQVHDAMTTAMQQGQTVLERDQIHITFAGYQVITRAMLDGLSLTHVKVPAELTLTLLPGVVREWSIQALPDKTNVDETLATQLANQTGGEGWKILKLPMTLPADADWWPKQEAARGFATDLQKLVGEPAAKKFVGVAKLHNTRTRKVSLNTGAYLQSIFLNGKLIWRQTNGWTGWHAGKERITVELPAGENALVIETGQAFFLSVTDVEIARARE